MRDYDASSSTWTTADSYRGSLAQPSTLHRYGFVENSPVNGWDAYGWCKNSAGVEIPGASPQGANGFCSVVDKEQYYANIRIPTAPAKKETQTPPPARSTNPTISAATSTPTIPTKEPSPIYCSYDNGCVPTPRPPTTLEILANYETHIDVISVVKEEGSDIASRMKTITNPFTGDVLHIPYKGLTDQQNADINNAASRYLTAFACLVDIAGGLANVYNAGNELTYDAGLLVIALILAGVAGVPTAGAGTVAVLSFWVGSALTVEQMIAFGKDAYQYFSAHDPQLLNKFKSQYKTFLAAWDKCDRLSDEIRSANGYTR